jgi:hypothetical protein
MGRNVRYLLMVLEEGEVVLVPAFEMDPEKALALIIGGLTDREGADCAAFLEERALHQISAM